MAVPVRQYIKRSLLYLNALLNHQKDSLLLTARGFLCLLSLCPQEAVKEATAIKEGEKIIEDKEFYQNFFLAVGKEMKNLLITEK